MPVYDLILLILVAAGAFCAGYLIGRLKALAEVGASRPREDTSSPLPGPSFDTRAPEEPSPVPQRPRGAPPPASAGGADAHAPGTAGTPSWQTPQRRSTRPPPAAAGLMGTGKTER